MGDKIDMSLDDIIKMDGVKGGKKRTVGQRGGLGGGRRGGFGGKANFGGNRLNLNAVRTGGVTKMRSNSRQTPYTRPGKLTGTLSGKWQHDMFEGGMRSGGGGGGAGHLLVTNLDYRVSDADIQELFAEFGMLRKASVHYDKSGRSLGTADVVYEERKNAVTAMQKYNGVPLDGRAMKITLVNNSSGGNTGMNRGAGGGSFQQQVGNSFGRLGQKRGGGRGGGFTGGNRRGPGRTAGGNVPTAEELDAELDAYVNKM